MQLSMDYNSVFTKPAFVFASGRSTLEMQYARHLELTVLIDWLGDVEGAIQDGLQGLSITECALISGVFNRISSALEYDHGITAPSNLIHKKPELRIKWLYTKLKNQA